ncbi:MAG: hypothetical protein ACYC56_12950 [Candidatus Aquicultor sp.]
MNRLFKFFNIQKKEEKDDKLLYNLTGKALAFADLSKDNFMSVYFPNEKLHKRATLLEARICSLFLTDYFFFVKNFKKEIRRRFHTNYIRHISISAIGLLEKNELESLINFRYKEYEKIGLTSKDIPELMQSLYKLYIIKMYASINQEKLMKLPPIPLWDGNEQLKNEILLTSKDAIYITSLVKALHSLL